MFIVVAVKLAPTTTPPGWSFLRQTNSLFVLQHCDLLLKLHQSILACIVEKADIGFVMDSSGSVSDTDWTKVNPI